MIIYLFRTPKLHQSKHHQYVTLFLWKKPTGNSNHPIYKKEMTQLYILFIFFGLHGDIISQMPTANSRPMPEYDPD